MAPKPLTIQMFSIHGLLRGHSLELGHDADTGGQIKYVVELAEALSRREDVARVELFTRLIADRRVSQDYAAAEEPLNDRCRIVRIQCGGRKYIRKELLWPHLDEFVDGVIQYNNRRRLTPDLVHGHYPDAGYVALQLARFFGTPFVFTGHSLGRSKQRRLLDEGLKAADIERKYKISRRIQVEEEILAAADLVVTSTTQEIEEQYGQYEQRRQPVYRVIPPGLDVAKFYPFYHDKVMEAARDEEAVYAQASVLQEMERFLMHPDKPLVLTLCRPDKRKNISGLIKAFGEDLELQSMANLAIFAGIRKDIAEMEDNERDVLTEILLLMDKYDLYGKLAIPKRHDFEYEVPALYRIAAQKGGVFVNPALTEPFGLTLIEAAACGLPVVATQDGGPKDILATCRCGLLVDPLRTEEISSAIKRMITDPSAWKTYSKNGILRVRRHYTWKAHAARYLEDVRRYTADSGKNLAGLPIGRRLARLQHLLVCDIDGTLIGDDNSRLPELIELLDAHRETLGFGVATGRTVDSAVAVLTRHGLPTPDIWITSVGAEIYYGEALAYDKGWRTRIAHRWDRTRIKGLLDGFDDLTYQDEASQRAFKISYDMQPDNDRLRRIQARLTQRGLRFKIIYSHDRHLDVLPYRASKGKALRYIAGKWNISRDQILVCGDSGNDAEMLRGDTPAGVVGNYAPELEALRGMRQVFFAAQPCAGGVLEAIAHFGLLEAAQP
jgi:sucrose-phosphate synthase